MRKTGIGRELRNESIACRPWSLNLADKSLREVLHFCAVHLLRLTFPFFLLPWDLDLRFRISKREKTSKSGILEMFPSWKVCMIYFLFRSFFFYIYHPLSLCFSLIFNQSPCISKTSMQYTAILKGVKMMILTEKNKIFVLCTYFFPLRGRGVGNTEGNEVWASYISLFEKRKIGRLGDNGIHPRNHSYYIKGIFFLHVVCCSIWLCVCVCMCVVSGSMCGFKYI